MRAVGLSIGDVTMKHSNLPALVVLCSLLAGCTAHYPVNEPYSPVVAVGAGPSQLKAGETRSDSLLVGLAFSGGGTRAAAFAYGVLEVMAEAYVRWEGRELRWELAASSVASCRSTAGVSSARDARSLSRRSTR